jgi:hypothetical protein
MMIGTGNHPYRRRVLALFRVFLVVKRQAEVSAIRFSPTSLPDSGKSPRKSEHCVQNKEES